MRAIVVAGARPNFVKVKPLLDALDGAGVDTIFVHTGQHYDDLLERAVFHDLGLRRPDRELGVGSGSHAEQVARVMLALEPIVADEAPDDLVIVGDVNSTLGAALVGAKAPCRVSHVEAGLRSGDTSMPEEVNRLVADRVSDLLFAPSQDAVDNLVREGVPADRTFLVGNVMVDSLLALLPSARARATASRLGLRPGDYALATLHRPATVDDPAVLDEVLQALAEVGGELPVLLAAHPRTLRALDGLDVPSAVRAVPSFGYLDFVSLQADAAVVVTDSGGVQEETTVLGIPCVTVRTTTERPITVTHGTNEVVGVRGRDLVEGVRRALTRTRTGARPPLWDGRTASRIVDILIADR